MINQQSRNELVYEWKAVYDDGFVLYQYDDTKNREYHFGHINQKKLAILTLFRRNDLEKNFSVDIHSGLFYVNNKLEKKLGKDVSNLKVETENGKVKVIMFRRVHRNFGPGVALGLSPPLEIVYFLGWEAKVAGKFEKHGIAIKEDGSYRVPVEDGFKAI